MNEKDDKKRSRDRYEFRLPGDPDDPDDRKESGVGFGRILLPSSGRGDVRIITPHRDGSEVKGKKKKRRIESERVTEVDPRDTIGGLPLEMVHAIMSFAGLGELLSIARTSTTHRGLLMQMMGRRDADRALRMKIRKRDYGSSQVCLLGEGHILAVSERFVASINDVIVEDESVNGIPIPIKLSRGVLLDTKFAVDINGSSEQNAILVEGYDMRLLPIRVVFGHPYRVVSRAVEVGLIPPLKYICFTSPLDSVFVSTPFPRDIVVSLAQDVIGYEANRSVYESMRRDVSWYQVILFHLRGDVLHFHNVMGFVRYARFVNEDTIVMDVTRDRDLKEHHIVCASVPGFSMLWEMDIGDKQLESVCEIVNGIILLSVIHPEKDRRTVFAIERGSPMKRVLHLDTLLDDPKPDEATRVIKLMAYDKGVLMMVLGPDNPKLSYDKVLALDMLHGTHKEWKIEANASMRTQITEARGLQFVLGNEYVQVVLL